MTAVKAEPYEFEFAPTTTALVIIDMQRDFVDPGGFGEALGNDVSLLRKAIAPTQARARRGAAARACSSSTRARATAPTSPTAAGQEAARPPQDRHRRSRADGPHPRARRARPRHRRRALADAGEPVVDKPGKGAFYATDLDSILQNRGIRQLVVCGVTTEVCVNTTVREANDRGYDCLVLEDCVGSYFPEFQRAALEMIKAQGGIFGWVSDSGRFLAALGKA